MDDRIETILLKKIGENRRNLERLEKLNERLTLTVNKLDRRVSEITTELTLKVDVLLDQAGIDREAYLKGETDEN